MTKTASVENIISVEKVQIYDSAQHIIKLFMQINGQICR